MKSFWTTLLLAALLIPYWGCSHQANKEGTAPETPDRTTVESPRGNEAGRKDEDAGKVFPAEGQEETKEYGSPDKAGRSLNIDEEKETLSIFTVIEELETCYRTKNFEKWLSLLTPSYRRHFNNQGLLEAEGWDADNINEFFDLLVQTRRKSNIADLEISRVEFLNDDKAYVYVLLEGEEFPVPQHTFIRISDSWLKGLSNEGD
jgi:hypothetical protein